MNPSAHNNYKLRTLRAGIEATENLFVVKRSGIINQQTYAQTPI